MEEVLRRGYCKSFNTACGAELACAMAAIEACCNTDALVRLAASVATSASRSWASAEEKFVICELAREIAYPNVFSPAPTLPWTEPRVLTALCTAETAARELPVMLPLLAGLVIVKAPVAKPPEVPGAFTVPVKALALWNEIPVPAELRTALTPVEASCVFSDVTESARLVPLASVAVTVLPPEVIVMDCEPTRGAVNAALEL